MTTPAISIVTPVYNGQASLERAVESVRRQTFADWQLLLVDDGSTDGSLALMHQLARSDPRTCVQSLPVNSGVSVARNTALRRATGLWIVYLDCDDEFYCDYLERVWQHRDQADVLVFEYDQLELRPDHPACGHVSRYQPVVAREHVLTTNTVVPLGVAHRRSLLERTGLFDESLGRHRDAEEDTDLWRRFALAGASFAYLPNASGRYHVRADSLARVRPARPPAHARCTARVPFAGRDLRLSIWPEHEVYLREVFEHGVYGARPAVPTGTPVVVDLGAGVGVFSLFMSAAWPNARVYAFETDPHLADLLRHNIAPYSAIQAVAWPHEHWPTVWDTLAISEVHLLRLTADEQTLTLLDALGKRVQAANVIHLHYCSQQLRRQVDAWLAGYMPVRIHPLTHERGVVTFVRL